MQNKAISIPASKAARVTQDIAEALAIDVLSFLAADVERLERFLALSGLTAESLRTAASEPGFFVAILDHLAADETLLLAFAANAGQDPTMILKARDCLAPPDDAE